MFAREELSRIDPRLPEDYEDKSREFWDYVDERFRTVSGRLKKIYLESSGVMGKRHLEMLKTLDPSQHRVVSSAIESGAEMVEAESPELVLETLSWMQKIQDLVSGGAVEEEAVSVIQNISQMLQDSMKERDEFVKNRIESTLQDGEIGALVMDLTREIDFSDDIRVVITCPFRPRDYLNSWLAGLRARDQMESEEEGEKPPEDEPESTE
jgi:hypothetical protein